MMLFPGADGVMGWGMLKYDGAFKGAVWTAANEVNTQIIVLLFTMAALVNLPPALTEMFLTFSHPNDVGRLFPRPVTLRERRTFLVFANLNAIFMFPLTFSTWMIPVERRPFIYTAIFLPLSFGCGIAAGSYLACAGTSRAKTCRTNAPLPAAPACSGRLSDNGASALRGAVVRRLDLGAVHASSDGPLVAAAG